ncbi:MAG: hypothetical protein ACJ8IK_07360 [Burkholderiaceae bacterium]
MAVLLSMPLAALTGSARHVQRFQDGENWEVSIDQGARSWSVDQDTLQSIRAQLSGQLEWLASAKATPTPQDFHIRVHGELRQDGRRVVFVQGDCTAAFEDQRHPSTPVAQSTDATLNPAPAVAARCEFNSIYDVGIGAFIHFESSGLGVEASAGRIDCSHETFTTAKSLRDLPNEIRLALSAYSALGDSGAKFTPTCTAPDIERHRFMIAAVGNRLAYALVESGGNAYSVTTWSFRKRGDHWQGESTAQWDSPLPTSFEGLLSHTCIGVPPPPMRTRLENVTDHILSEVDEDGSLRLSIAIDGLYVYVLRLHAPSQSTVAGDEILDAREGDRPITKAERVALRDRLLAIRQASKPADSAYATLGTYLIALQLGRERPPRVAKSR